MSFPRQFLEAIAQAEVVSFDVYDTLVVRSVWEPHAFLRMERVLVEERGPTFHGFARSRHASEVAEAEHRWQVDRGREFTLEDVYERFSVGHPGVGSFRSRARPYRA